jgi:hypothetical protein
MESSVSRDSGTRRLVWKDSSQGKEEGFCNHCKMRYSRDRNMTRARHSQQAIAMSHDCQLIDRNVFPARIDGFGDIYSVQLSVTPTDERTCVTDTCSKAIAMYCQLRLILGGVVGF